MSLEVKNRPSAATPMVAAHLTDPVAAPVIASNVIEAAAGRFPLGPFREAFGLTMASVATVSATPLGTVSIGFMAGGFASLMGAGDYAVAIGARVGPS